MTYSRLESSLPRHPKTARLARALGTTRIEAMGWLAAWWCWLQETRPSGDLSGIEPAELDLVLDWPGPGSLAEALITCGWIDRREDGSLEAHGWLERAESYRAAQSEARRRTRVAQEGTPVHPTPAPHVAHAPPTDAPQIPPRGERGERGEIRSEEPSRGADASRGRARAPDQGEGEGQATGPQPTPEPDPHGLAEPEDVERRHATTGRHRLPCTPQAVLDAWERVCVPAGHPRAVATGERASAELLRTVTAALERAPHRGAVWWEGTYLPALVADTSLGAQTRRQAGPAGLALACREQVISEVLARREASQARGIADDVDSPARIAAIERARAELRGEDPGGATQASPGAPQEARPTTSAQLRSTAPPGLRQGARTHGERQPVRAGQVDLTRALGGGR